MTAHRFDHDAALQDAREGLTVLQIAAKHDVSRRAIYWLMRKHDIKPAASGRHAVQSSERQERRPDLDVLAALAAVPSDEREAFVDHYILGDTLQQIADRIGVSKATVGVRAERARQRLADQLQQRTAA